MQLSDVHQRRLLDEFTNNPLQEGEVRRVVGLGQLYVALPATVPSQEGYRFARLYSLRFDGVEHVFYARLDANEASD